MKQVFKQYGRIIVTIIVCTSLLTILTIMKDSKGNVGIFNILGYYMTLKEDDMNNLSDKISTKESVDHPAPVIVYDATGLASLVCNSEVNILSYFNVIYYDPSSDSIKTTRANLPGSYSLALKGLYNSDGIDMTTLVDETGNITFPTSGIYIVKFRVVDSLNQYTTNTFEIPVDIP